MKEIRAVVPIRGLQSLTEIESCYMEFERLVKELPLLSNNKNLNFLLDDNEELDKFYLEEITFSFSETNEYLDGFKKKLPRFRVEYESDFLLLDVQFNRNLSIEGVESMIDTCLERLLVLLCLAYATSVSFAPGPIYCQEKCVGKTGVFINTLDFAYEQAHKISWPISKGVGFEQLIWWMEKHKINLYTRSNNAASRAINACSHMIFSRLGSFDADHLFWCMLGLEAMYAKGSSAVSEQIREKTVLVLGSPKEYKKKLNQLYAFRSRLIHGDLNITPSYGMDHENYGKEYGDYLAFGTSILLQSIRELVRNDITSFEFSFNWSNKATS